MSTISQRSFAAGELSPRLYSRCDTVKYATGARTLRNYLVMRDGGATSRPGTEFICEVYDSAISDNVKLIPFVFNDSQTYVLEFGNGYFRVIRNGLLLNESGKLITAITQASQAVATVTAHGYSTGDQSYIDAGTILGGPPGRIFLIEVVDVDHFKIKYLDGTYVNTSAAPAFSSGTSQRIYKHATVYFWGDLPTLKYVQSADVVTLAHPSYAPYELKRTGDINWTITTVSFGPSISMSGYPSFSYGAGSLTYAYYVTAIKAETFEESYAVSVSSSVVAAPSGTAPHNISWPSATGAQAYNIYIAQSGASPSFLATAQVSPFLNTGLNPNYTQGPPVARTLFNSSNNYPSCVTYYQQRLVFGNTNTQPETVFASKSGNFKNFTTSFPLQDDDAVTFTMAGRQVNSIRHLLDLGKLVIFTPTGEWSAEGNGAGTLTPTGINLKQESYYGCSDLPPIAVGNSALYVQARGSIVRDLNYDFQTQGYHGNDLTVFSSHLVENNTIVDWAFQQVPHSVLWMVRSDGVLLSLTYVKEQQILGWARHDTDGFVLNVTVLPEGNEDRVYLVVQRTINGRIVRYIERLCSLKQTDITSAIFMDCALTYSGVPASTISGLWHLEGKAVSVMGDGNVVASPNNPDYPVITVTNGTITLPRQYSTVHVGLPYTSDLETLDIDTPNGETLADKRLLVRAVTIHTYNSQGGFVGATLPDTGHSLAGMDELRSRDDSDAGDGPTPYLPEKIVQKIEGHWNSNGRIAIRQVDPLPLSILAVHPDVVKG